MSQLMTLVPKQKLMMRELKRQASANEWGQLQSLVGEVLGLNEADAVSDQQIEDLIMKAAKELKAAGKIDAVPTEIDIDKLEKGDESGIKLSESKRQLHEDIITALILAAPTLLELLAKLIEAVYRRIAMSDAEREQWKKKKAAFNSAKKTGKSIDGKPLSKDDIHHMEDELYKSKAGKFILKAAHWLHDAYISPLRLVIAGISYAALDVSWRECWKESKQAAETIYCIIMIGIAGYGIVHALPGITGLAASALAPVATVAVDATKGQDMTATILKKILGHVHI
jgi:hypothetical protein